MNIPPVANTVAKFGTIVIW